MPTFNVIIRIRGEDVAVQKKVRALTHLEAARAVARPEYPPEGEGRTVVYFPANQVGGDAQAEIDVERIA